MAYIYKITNTENCKFYIGATVRTPEKRFKQHQINAFNTLSANYDMLMYRHMRRFGKDKFSVEVIEECPDEQVSEREVFWIKTTGAVENGYNSNACGHTMPVRKNPLTYVACVDENGKQTIFSNAVVAANYCIGEGLTNADLKTVHKRVLSACNGKRRTAYNRYWHKVYKDAYTFDD